MEIQISQILFQIINFSVVLGALTFLMYKPILKTLEMRAKKIEESQKAADEVLKEKTEIENLKKKASTDAKKEATQLLNQAKEDVEAKKKELLAKAKDEVKAYLEDEKKKWESEKKTLVKQMEQQFSDAVFQVAGKVIGSLDAKAHSKLVDQSIKEIVSAL